MGADAAYGCCRRSTSRPADRGRASGRLLRHDRAPFPSFATAWSESWVCIRPRRVTRCARVRHRSRVTADVLYSRLRHPSHQTRTALPNEPALTTRSSIRRSSCVPTASSSSGARAFHHRRLPGHPQPVQRRDHGSRCLTGCASTRSTAPSITLGAADAAGRFDHRYLPDRARGLERAVRDHEVPGRLRHGHHRR